MRARIELSPGVELAITTNAMVRYQEAAGETIFQGLQAFDTGDLDIRRLRLMIWAGLVDRSRGLDEIGDLIDELGIRAAAEKLGAAVRAAFPDAGEGGAAPAEKT
jgi:hypothetical protein